MEIPDQDDLYTPRPLTDEEVSLTVPEEALDEAVQFAQKSEKPLKNSITIVQNVYHRDRVNHSNPYQITTRSYQELETDEQPFVRKTKVGKTWDNLDCGWLEDPSLLIIHNTDQREESPILTVGVKYGRGKDDIKEIWFVCKGRDCRVEPFDVNELYIKSDMDNTKYTLYALPE